MIDLKPSPRQMRERARQRTQIAGVLVLGLFVGMIITTGCVYWFGIASPRALETQLASEPSDAAVNEEGTGPQPPTDSMTQFVSQLAENPDPSEITSNGENDRTVTVPPDSMIEVSETATSDPRFENLDDEIVNEYKKAVDLELSSNFDRALIHYRRLSSSPNDRVVWASQLGQARILQKLGSLQQSRAILSGLAMQEARLSHNDSKVFSDAIHLLGQVVADAVLQSGVQDLLDDRAPASFPPQFSKDHIFGLLSGDPTTSQTERIAFRISTSFGQDISTAIGTGYLAHQPVIQFLESTAEKLGLKLSMAQETRSALETRFVTFDTKNVSLAILLDNVLGPLDAVWLEEAGQLRIVHRLEDPAIVTDAYPAVATRALELANTLYPEHPLAPGNFLALANIAFHGKNFPSAMAIYTNLIEQYQNSAAVQFASFNLAKAQYLSGQTDAALASLYQVVDRRLGSPVESTAHLFLGRILFELGKSAEAIRELNHAKPTAGVDHVSAHLSLCKAICYLQQGNYPAASKVLFQGRESLEATEYRSAAALVSSLARISVPVGEQEKIRRGRSLVESMVRVNPDNFFGFFGHVLLIDVFREHGFPDHAVEIADLAISKSPHPQLLERIQFGKLLALLDAAKSQEAKVGARELTQSSGRYGVQSAIVLAQMLVRERELDECIAVCRKALDRDCDESQKKQLLRLMGEAYQWQDDSYSAAICFSGLIPKEVPASLRDPVSPRRGLP